MIKKILLFLFLSKIIFCQEVLKYSFKEGDQLQYYSEVKNDFESDPDNSKGSSVTKSTVTCIAEDNSKNIKSFVLDKKYEVASKINGILKNNSTDSVRISQDEYGYEKIIKDSPVKTMFNIPAFPQKPVKVGDRWQSVGSIRYENLFGIHQKVKFDVVVQYEYIKKELKDGKNIAVIVVQFNKEVNLRPVLKNRIQMTDFDIDSYGEFSFDLDNQKPYYYKDDFHTTIIFNTGEVEDVESSSFTKISYLNIKQSDKDIQNTQKLAKELDAQVTNKNNHVYITIPNLQFDMNSYQISPEVKAKLEKIGKLVSAYKGRNILIKGHTSYENNGTNEDHKLLSENRARVIAKYLINNHILSQEHVSYIGLGHSEPLYKNDTKEHIEKNRRVEIIIE